MNHETARFMKSERKMAYFLTTFWALRIVRLRSRSTIYDTMSVKAKDPLPSTLYLFLFRGAEPGDTCLFLAVFRGAFCFFGLRKVAQRTHGVEQEKTNLLLPLFRGFGL